MKWCRLGNNVKGAVAPGKRSDCGPGGPRCRLPGHCELIRFSTGHGVDIIRAIIWEGPSPAAQGSLGYGEGEAAEGGGLRHVLSQVREVERAQDQPCGIWPQPYD